MAYQSEQELENKLVAQLAKQGFKPVQITDTKSLRANLNSQLSKLNGFEISDTELNDSIIRIAANNQMELQQFIDYVEQGGESYEDLRENVKKQIDQYQVELTRQSKLCPITSLSLVHMDRCLKEFVD